MIHHNPVLLVWRLVDFVINRALRILSNSLMLQIRQSGSCQVQMDEGEQSRGYGPLEQSQTSWGGVGCSCLLSKFSVQGGWISGYLRWWKTLTFIAKKCSAHSHDVGWLFNRHYYTLIVWPYIDLLKKKHLDKKNHGFFLRRLVGPGCPSICRSSQLGRSKNTPNPSSFFLGTKRRGISNILKCRHWKSMQLSSLGGSSHGHVMSGFAWWATNKNRDF